MAFFYLRVERLCRIGAATIPSGTLLGLHRNGNVSVINSVPERIYIPRDGQVEDLVKNGRLTVFRMEKAEGLPAPVEPRPANG